MILGFGSKNSGVVNDGYFASAFCQHTNARFSSENTAAARTSGFEDEAP